MRVVFLTSHTDGYAAYNILSKQPNAEIVYTQFSGKLKSFSATPYTLGISYFYNFRIPASELELNHIWINFHPAPLPEYRGRNVAYHAILNGEKEFGATIHYVDEDFDTGNFIEVSRFPILDNYNAGDIAKLARRECLNLFQKYVPLLLSGIRPNATPQSHGTSYRKTPINSYIILTPDQQMTVRAITADPYFAKTIIGGIEYELRPVHSPTSIVHHSDDEPQGLVNPNVDQSVRDDTRA